MSTRFLITGGAGFIGSHLAERIIAEQHRVVVLDNLSTGRRDNIAHLESNELFEFIEGDILDDALVDGLISSADYVYHLAAAVGVSLVLDDPLEAMTTNIKGAEYVVSAASLHQTPILIASTSEVYGKNTKVPFTEDDELVFGATSTLRWSYACSKAVDEFLALAHHKKNGLPVSIVRFFNTVGPRQTGHYGMVLPRFVRQALNNEPLSVHGDGSQCRTFTHISDTVDATWRLSQANGSVGAVFNIGGAEEISIMDLAKRVKQRVKSDSRICTTPYSEVFGNGDFEDMKRRVPDTQKINALIGYKPTKTIDDMIDSVVEYFKTNPSFS